MTGLAIGFVTGVALTFTLMHFGIQKVLTDIKDMLSKITGGKL